MSAVATGHSIQARLPSSRYLQLPQLDNAPIPRVRISYAVAGGLIKLGLNRADHYSDRRVEQKETLCWLESRSQQGRSESE